MFKVIKLSTAQWSLMVGGTGVRTQKQIVVCLFVQPEFSLPQGTQREAFVFSCAVQHVNLSEVFSV